MERTRIRMHPGEVLAEDFLGPLGMSGRQLADAIGVPPSRVTDLIRQRRGMSADTAIRLGRYFGTDPRYWLNLQIEHDLSRAEAEGDYSAIRRRA